MKDSDGYCCLGVLAQRINPDGFLQDEDCGEAYYVYWESPDGEILSVTSVPENLGGLDFQICSTLAGKNDGLNGEGGPQSFPEIADWIEANL